MESKTEWVQVLGSFGVWIARPGAGKARLPNLAALGLLLTICPAAALAAPGPHGPVITTALHVLGLTHDTRMVIVISNINIDRSTFAAAHEAPYVTTGIHARVTHLAQDHVTLRLVVIQIKWNLLIDSHQIRRKD